MARTRSGSPASDHLPRSLHAELQARPARRRRRSRRFDAGRRRSNSAASTSSATVSPTRFYKPVVPPGAGLFTTNPGPVWPTVLRKQASGSPPILRTRPGRNELRARRRARDEPSRVSAHSTDRVRRSDRYASADVSRQGPARPECDLFSSGGRQRLPLPVRRFSQPGRSRQRRCRRRWRLARSARRRRSATCSAAGAQYISRWNLPDVRTHA